MYEQHQSLATSLSLCTYKNVGILGVCTRICCVYIECMHTFYGLVLCRHTYTCVDIHTHVSTYIHMCRHTYHGLTYMLCLHACASQHKEWVLIYNIRCVPVSTCMHVKHKVPLQNYMNVPNPVGPFPVLNKCVYMHIERSSIEQE